MFIKPAEGRKVRRPDTYAFLDVQGEEVPDVDYWFLRLRDKDVVLVDRPTAPAAAEPTKPAEPAAPEAADGAPLPAPETPAADAAPAAEPEAQP